MASIINGSSPTVTFSDGTTQATSAIVSGYVPYANLPAGSVLQVVNGTYASPTVTSSTTYVDTGVTATITPKFSTSKILVLVSGNSISANSGASTCTFELCLANGSNTNLLNLDSQYATNYNTAGASYSANYLHSPATTSAYTYKLQVKVTGGTGVIFGNNYSFGPVNSITLMEIAQ